MLLMSYAVLRVAGDKRNESNKEKVIGISYFPRHLSK